jgi:phosphoadenosine phosphosulfate reductase
MRRYKVEWRVLPPIGFAFVHRGELRRGIGDDIPLDPIEFLAGASAWITGLRADQSPERAQTCYAGFNPLYRVIKINPLFDWTRDRVVAFVHNYDIPYNPLHERGFLSIGCAPCTRAVLPGEAERAGRWWWEQQEKTECRLHTGHPAWRPEPAQFEAR